MLATIESASSLNVYAPMPIVPTNMVTATAAAIAGGACSRFNNVMIGINA